MIWVEYLVMVFEIFEEKGKFLIDFSDFFL